MTRTRRHYSNVNLCPRCLTAITDEFSLDTPDGKIHEACESLPRPSKQRRNRWTESSRAAEALAKSRLRMLR